MHVSCTALLAAFAATGNATKADALVAKMRRLEIRPTDRTYTMLVAAHERAGQWPQAVRVRTIPLSNMTGLPQDC